MSVRIKHKVTVRAWEEAEQRNALFAPDDSRSEITIDNMLHFYSGLITVENGTNIALPLPDIAAVAGVFLKADQDITVAINGGAAIQLRRPSVGTSDAITYCHFFFEGDITSITIAKPDVQPLTALDDADASVRWVVWGEREA